MAASFHARYTVCSCPCFAHSLAGHAIPAACAGPVGGTRQARGSWLPKLAAAPGRVRRFKQQPPCSHIEWGRSATRQVKSAAAAASPVCRRPLS